MSRHTRHLDRVPTEQSITLRPDAEGYLGRECPEEACARYFKITPGTGLKGIDTCRCPYCGFVEHHSHFHTQAQTDHAVSVLENQVMGALLKDLKSLEFDHRPRGAFGIGFSMKVEGRVPPVRGYTEFDLETEVTCQQCALRYAIYGVFGFCPDCGQHNNRGILEANLRLVERMLELAGELDDAALCRQLVDDALENCVSAFDGWGRAVTEAFASKAVAPAQAPVISFQNLKKAQKRLTHHFAFDPEHALGEDPFADAHRAFQKRHLVAHRMGVVDQAYLDSTGDTSAVLGRKVTISAEEVGATARVLAQLADALLENLEARP